MRRKRLTFSLALLLAPALLPISSCSSAGIRRAYVALDSSAHRKLTDQEVVYQNDSEVFAIAEVVAGRADSAVTCRWTFFQEGTESVIPIDLSKISAIEQPEFEGTASAATTFAWAQYPGQGENLRVSCALRQPPAPPGSAASGWGFSQGLEGVSVQIAWYLDSDTPSATSSFTIVQGNRPIPGGLNQRPPADASLTVIPGAGADGGIPDSGARDGGG